MSKGGTERKEKDRDEGNEMPSFPKARFSLKSFYPFQIGNDDAFSLEARDRESSKTRTKS